MSESDELNVVRQSLLRGGRHRPVTREEVRDSFMTSVEFFTRPMRKTVGEDETIQVVGLVLETSSECPGANYFDIVAVLILSSTNCVIGTQGFDKRAGKR
jgi:hypothetical protein